MQQMGFREDASPGAKEAFLKHLIKASTGASDNNKLNLYILEIPYLVRPEKILVIQFRLLKSFFP